MLNVVIDAIGCRDCAICEEICPTKVFAYQGDKMQPTKREDCIGCLSCVSECPSRCIHIDDAKPPTVFHRDPANAAMVNRLVSSRPKIQLTEELVDQALADVQVRLFALGESITDTMGRGVRAVGKKAGTLAAEHLPDLYERIDFASLMTQLCERFPDAFKFEATTSNDNKNVAMAFPHCAVASVVQKNAQMVDSSVLCVLFHEYWAGLMSAASGNNFSVESVACDDSCRVQFVARG